MDIQGTTPSTSASGVYQRTVQGQRELVSPTGVIGDHERRLLSMLTGFTTTNALLALLPKASAADMSMDRLLETGLAEPVTELAIRPA